MGRGKSVIFPAAEAPVFKIIHAEFLAPGIKRFVKMYRQAFPDIQFKFEDIVTQDDKVAVRWTTVGTHKGALFGIKPTGKKMTVTGIGIAQIADGRIRVSNSEIDMLSLVSQLGAGPKIG